jgi:uncharacterized membrane protein
MSQKKHHTEKGTREGKREQFASHTPEQKSGKFTSILILVALVLAGLVVYVVINNRNDVTTSARTSAASPLSSSTVTANTSGDITIPVSELGSQARFYEYKAGATAVRFFVIKSSDGVYRAALDACDVCFAGKKGYAQIGDDMVCKKCGNHFHSADVNEVSGGCNPVGINRTVSGDRLVIKASELESKTSYF